jgi:hypothetical protein
MKKPDYRITVLNRILPYWYGSTVSPYGPIYRKGREGTAKWYGSTVREINRQTRQHRHANKRTALTLDKLTSQTMRNMLICKGVHPLEGIYST